MRADIDAIRSTQRRNEPQYPYCQNLFHNLDLILEIDPDNKFASKLSADETLRKNQTTAAYNNLNWRQF